MIKLIKVGDDLEIVRMSPDDPANTAQFPDGLNRTQLQLKEELKEFLNIENAEIQGVSKDIQLVSLVNPVNPDPFSKQVSSSYSAPAGVPGDIPFIQITGGDNPVFDNPLKYIIINNFQAVGTAGPANRSIEFRLTAELNGVKLDLHFNNETVTAGTTEYWVGFLTADNEMDYMLLREHPAGQPTELAKLHGYFMIPTNVFKNIKIEYTTALNDGFDVSFNATIKTTNNLNLDA